MFTALQTPWDTLKRTDMVKGALLLVIAILCFFFINLTGLFFWTLFFGFALFRIDSTYVGQAALVCLVFTALTNSFGKEAPAGQLAVYAFFLLCITVALQIIELKREPDEENLEDGPTGAAAAPVIHSPSIPSSIVYPEVNKPHIEIFESKPRKPKRVAEATWVDIKARAPRAKKVTAQPEAKPRIRKKI